jgi:transposase-like protein
MASNNSQYSKEMRERTAKHIIESGRSATSMAAELGIDVNTVCRWVRAFCRKNNLPSYAEAKGIKRSEPKTNGELTHRVKGLEKELT